MKICNRDSTEISRGPLARFPCSWDNPPTWSSDSRVRSWFVFQELLVQDCLLALKVCPVVSIVRPCCNARCLDGAFLRCCCCLASRVPLPNSEGPQRKRCCTLCVCVSSTGSRLQVGLKNIKIHPWFIVIHSFIVHNIPSENLGTNS